MAKTEGERGPFAAWVVRNRKRLYGTDLEQLSTALGKAGAPATVTTIRGWEAGSRPRPEAREVLERLFGEPAPADSGEVDLAGAIRDQTAVMQTIAAELEATRVAQQAYAEALAAILGLLAGRLGVPTPELVGRSLVSEDR